MLDLKEMYATNNIALEETHNYIITYIFRLNTDYVIKAREVFVNKNKTQTKKEQ